MKGQFIKLAWRNIWRNKRRAFITMGSIVISLFFVLFIRQMQLWTFNYNIETAVSGYVGYLQITDTAFIDEQTLDNSITLDQIPSKEIQDIEGVRGVFPRIMNGALASIGIKSKGTAIMGITPSIDAKEMELEQKLIDGELISDQDESIMITSNMAKFYKVSIGDSIVLFSQGYQGYTAAGVYPIKGILDMPTGAMSNMIFMSLPSAQYFYAAEDRITSLLINIDKPNDLENIKAEIQSKITDQSLVVRTWKEVSPELSQGFDLSSNSGIVIAGILYMIVGFGMFGTMVMLYNERLFEFGVLLSIGMKKISLLFVTIMEMIILTIGGIVLGNIAVFPLLYYLNQNPIELTGDAAESAAYKGVDPIISTGLFSDVFIANSITILIISLVLSFYLIIKILKLKPLEAMRKN